MLKNWSGGAAPTLFGTPRKCNWQEVTAVNPAPTFHQRNVRWPVDGRVVEALGPVVRKVDEHHTDGFLAHLALIAGEMGTTFEPPQGRRGFETRREGQAEASWTSP